MHQIPEHHGNLGWNQILGLDRVWRSWSSTNSGTTLKSMRDDGVELWGWCVTARIHSLSLAEPQHNTTQLLCHNMSCWIYLALSSLPVFCSLAVKTALSNMISRRLREAFANMEVLDQSEAAGLTDSCSLHSRNISHLFLFFFYSHPLITADNSIFPYSQNQKHKAL